MKFSTLFDFACAVIVTACHAAPPVSSASATAGDSVTQGGLRLHRSADAIRIVTSDISRFWLAVDHAANKDSATRVRLFRDEYFGRATIGLRDFVRLKLVRGHSDTTLAAYGALADTASVQLAAATARWPRYYAGIRSASLAADTSAELVTTVRNGLRRLTVLYPPARFPDVYFVVGRAATGGTSSANGLLMGVEIFSRGPATPVDELPPGERLAATIAASGVLGPLVVHEAVHFLQPTDPEQRGLTLLKRVLLEGGANFLAELATHPFVDRLEYQRYGDAHADALWKAFREDMNGIDSHRWISNYTVADNLGMPDLGYWVGYKISAGYYARAADKRAAVRDLIQAREPERIWRASGYDGAP